MTFRESPSASIRRAAEILRQSHAAVALTGAGQSTPSGIPDFRSPGSGLWQQDDPMVVASLTTFLHRPERFFAWFRPLTEKISRSEPNAGHIALARLEQAGILKGVITQNIDDMHQRAGSKNVMELHGSIRTVSCLKCQNSLPAEPFIPPYVEDGVIPHCPVCDSILKPDIVFFEEMLPEAAWKAAEAASRSCDVMLIVGSSLEVYPAAILPELALQNDARLIINNRSPTHFDADAAVILREDLAVALPQIVDLLL